MATRAEKIDALKALVASQISDILDTVYPAEAVDITPLMERKGELAGLVALYHAAEIAESANKQSTYNLGNII
ncbi:hypothetical protein [Phyllobacterium endophyticum]|uniref:Uncharacterized protein n=1 Tax=Phyllobacterium endophyticum TaxID=1149773 RepID=A0A2P7B0H4_9HYPH|nr:hypothetical protein [Phyllobacterium endophyticum]MBB3235361.1 hypothetical protein [Phyllobacterium endophyticum]PSH59959.1 hypothetical protein CU100_04300 [Phyllobacterium endophyticum]TYR42127.1 hypothetical protein FY050_12900 [Phyllobacterium endophyticum]